MQSLDFCQELRRRRAAGEDVRHVSLSSEQSGNQTLSGVDEVDLKKYDWSKRRYTGPVGRDSAKTSTS